MNQRVLHAQVKTPLLSVHQDEMQISDERLHFSDSAKSDFKPSVALTDS